MRISWILMSMRRAFRRSLGKYLTVKRSYLRGILAGRKTATIRLGVVYVPYRRVFLECGGRVYGELEITDVKYRRLNELDEHMAREDGFASLGELIAALTGIYPSITPEDTVTIIRFRLLARYPEPVSRWDVEYRGDVNVQELSRRALARGLVRSREEYKVLHILAEGASFDEAAAAMGANYTPSFIKAIFARVAKRLSERGF